MVTIGGRVGEQKEVLCIVQPLSKIHKRKTTTNRADDLILEVLTCPGVDWKKSNLETS